jgi:tight adherence protein B
MTRGRLAVALVAATAALGLPGAPAGAATATPPPPATGRITSVLVDEGVLRTVFRVDGLPEGVTVDTESAALLVEGRRLDATARVEDPAEVTNVAVLAIDNSKSMDGPKLDAAKAAAREFLTRLPPDVRVGLVTFGHEAVAAVPPTEDRAAVQAPIDGLVLDEVTGTALFDAVAAAADLTGDVGSRSVILLTDGNEDGSSSLSQDGALSRLNDDGVGLDAVYIDDSGSTPLELVELVGGADGILATAGTEELAGIFGRYAAAIENQLVIEAPVTDDLPSAGSVVVTVTAGDQTISDDAFTRLPVEEAPPPGDTGPKRVDAASPNLLQTTSALPFILGALFLAVLVLLLIALSTLRRDDRATNMRRRLSLYTLTGRPGRDEPTSTVLGASQVARTAVELAGRVVRRRDFEGDLALRLEAAGVPLRAAEWMLLHIGAAISAALLMLLLSGGQLLPAFLGLVAGLGLPFAYLIARESRRTSAFLGQLPDTLQLIAGSLTAGYSMAQAMDTVVREGTQPIVGEFNRALVEARLGVPIEDALDGVAERMKSKDFAWVVMAIRIQREVGGNLAELLTTVSGTLRERERLRRQVKVLSAEGRLSAWILGLLPPAFALYLVLVQPDYLRPLVTHALGWTMVTFAALLLTVGVLWMRRAVRVEV